MAAVEVVLAFDAFFFFSARLFSRSYSICLSSAGAATVELQAPVQARSGKRLAATE